MEIIVGIVVLASLGFLAWAVSTARQAEQARQARLQLRYRTQNRAGEV